MQVLAEPPRAGFLRRHRGLQLSNYALHKAFNGAARRHRESRPHPLRRAGKTRGGRGRPRGHLGRAAGAPVRAESGGLAGTLSLPPTAGPRRRPAWWTSRRKGAPRWMFPSAPTSPRTIGFSARTSRSASPSGKVAIRGERVTISNLKLDAFDGPVAGDIRIPRRRQAGGRAELDQALDPRSDLHLRIPDERRRQRHRPARFLADRRQGGNHGRRGTARPGKNRAVFRADVRPAQPADQRRAE